MIKSFECIFSYPDFSALKDLPVISKSLYKTLIRQVLTNSCEARAVNKDNEYFL